MLKLLVIMRYAQADMQHSFSHFKFEMCSSKRISCFVKLWSYGTTVLI